MPYSEPAGPIAAWSADKFDRPPTVKVPKELQSIDAVPHIKPFEINVIGGKLGNVSDEPVEPFVPEWVSVRANPGRSLDQSGFAPRVRSRGREVTPLVVYPPDDRRAYNDFSYPWGCICRVVTNAGSGSGMLVGPNHVLTANHIVNWDLPGGVNGVVEVQRNFGEVGAVSPIIRVHAYKQILGGRPRWFELDEDYAVLETQDAIGTRFGYVGVRRYDSSWDGWPVWSNVGYPANATGENFVPQRQYGKWLDEHGWDRGGGRAMDTDADINLGCSGGPMFARFTDDGVYIVAVVAAEELRRRENYCAGGSDIVRLVRQART